jgi:diketogulonate reductase-like aldo/keto reductase
VPGHHVAAWKSLEQLHSEGKVRQIGLSNYTIEDYNELKPHITVKPSAIQVRCECCLLQTFFFFVVALIHEEFWGH